MVAASRRKMATITRTAPAYALDEDIGYLLGRAYTEGHRNLLKEFGSYDMTPSQFVLLAQLQQTGATSQNQLGRLCGMKPATAHIIVDRLIARGLVATSQHESDQRLTIVSLTDLAHEVLDELKERALVAREKSLARLSANDTEFLRRILKKLF